MREIIRDKEREERLKRLEIIIDSREQRNEHIIEYLRENNIGSIVRKLNEGDYSVQLDNMTFEDEVTIEKKNSLDEIAENMGQDRQRLENEFLRAKAKGKKIFLFIENGSWEDIEKHRYRSQLNPNSFIATLLSWQVRYNITINFVEKGMMGKQIYGTLYYWLKEHLK